MRAERQKGSEKPKGPHDKECDICGRFIDSKGFANHRRAHPDAHSESEPTKEVSHTQLVEAIKDRIVEVYREMCAKEPSIVEQGLDAILEATLRHYRYSRSSTKTGATAV